MNPKRELNRTEDATRRTLEWAAQEAVSTAALAGLELIRGSDVKPEPVNWLWDGWLAAGKVHILGGAPGTGKTTVALGLAATLTTGGRWPDGTRADVGRVVIWSGEDDPADTLAPRLAMAGADLAKTYFVGDVFDDEGRRAFDPARDVDAVMRKLAAIGNVKLLIVDPIVSAVAGDSHKNAEVRRGLQPLVELAAVMKCAVLGVTHFTKGTAGREPVERITGSLAFGALARVVLVAAKSKSDEGQDKRILCRAKSNLGPDTGGFEFDLRHGELEGHPGVFASTVLWGEPVDGTAHELLAAAEAVPDYEANALADAKLFLANLLADGPVPSKAVRAETEGAGHSWGTIRRAQKELGIEVVKEGGRFGETKPRWLWRLPDTNARLKVLKPNSEGAQCASSGKPHQNAGSAEDARIAPVCAPSDKTPEDAQQKNLSTFCNRPPLKPASEQALPEGAQGKNLERLAHGFEHLLKNGETGTDPACPTPPSAHHRNSEERF